MRSVLSDLRFAARMLRKSPGFAAVAIGTLALGIGANTATRSWLRPLPFPEPGRLGLRLGRYRHVRPNYVDWRARNRVFDEMGALEGATRRLSGDGEPEEIRGSVVTRARSAPWGCSR